MNISIALLKQWLCSWRLFKKLTLLYCALWQLEDKIKVAPAVFFITYWHIAPVLTWHLSPIANLIQASSEIPLIPFAALRLWARQQQKTQLCTSRRRKAVISRAILIWTKKAESTLCCIGTSALTIIAGQKGYIICVSAREKCEGSQEAKCKWRKKVNISKTIYSI